MKQTVKLVALKRMTYNTRHLVAGDAFDSNDRDARILIGTKKAMAAPPPTPPPPRPAPPPRSRPQDDEPDIGELQAKARALGVEVDNRWGARRLQSEIADKQAADKRGSV